MTEITTPQPAQPDRRLILAVRTELVRQRIAHDGFHPAEHEQIIDMLEHAEPLFAQRSGLEENEACLQPIPYIVLKSGDRYVSYVRTDKGGESRLHGRVSIGLGGHVDLADAATSEQGFELEFTLADGALRELSEEVSQDSVGDPIWRGVLVDTSSAVSRVHLGLVAVYELTDDELPASAEEEIDRVQLMTLEELRDCGDRLETWSSMLLNWLAEQ